MKNQGGLKDSEWFEEKNKESIKYINLTTPYSKVYICETVRYCNTFLLKMINHVWSRMGAKLPPSLKFIVAANPHIIVKCDFESFHKT